MLKRDMNPQSRLVTAQGLMARYVGSSFSMAEPSGSSETLLLDLRSVATNPLLPRPWSVRMRQMSHVECTRTTMTRAHLCNHRG